MSSATVIFGLALAGAPTAIVDSVSGVPDLRPFELLEAGAEINVAANGRVRLAYFASCVHETVSGGRLRVGVTASLVEDAKVERVTADCAAPGGSGRLAGAPAALLLRDSTARPHAGPVLRIRTNTPVLVAEPGTLVDLDRVDEDRGPRRVRIDGWTLPLVGPGLALEPGATYRVCARASCRTFWVDPSARVGAGPILERTIHVTR